MVITTESGCAREQGQFPVAVRRSKEARRSQPKSLFIRTPSLPPTLMFGNKRGNSQESSWQYPQSNLKKSDRFGRAWIVLEPGDRFRVTTRAHC
ncbi:MAG: hypothetical protein SW833_14775 [Cyanobacteriota bacterium]|nr:hypothetical protein [Cyanobacteriota bacterium]